jgi:hypothetical protein
MVAIVSVENPTPKIFWEEQRPRTRSNYAGVRVTSAVNLLEDRAFRQLERQQRLAVLLGEEQAYIGALGEHGIPAAFELRIIADPSQPVPVEVALLVRAWEDPNRADRSGRSLDEVMVEIVKHLQSGLPRHVTGEIVQDEGQLGALLRPFGAGDSVVSAVITKREMTGVPKRPDAKVAYYFSVAPFNWVINDWNQLYATLASVSSKVVISVGLLPLLVPDWFTDTLQHMATFYGRLARQDSVQGGLYFGQKTIPPDAFAVDAERIFSDYARRYVGKAFACRIQVSALSALPRGVVELLASLVSPSESGDESHMERQRVAASYEIRVPRNSDEELLSRWNLEAIDFVLLPGESTIWGRPDPPAPHLRALCVLADNKDASRAYRLPTALDGTVPGFRVRRGGFGHEEAVSTAGPSIQVGLLQGGQPLQIAVASLTKHSLVVGSTGSGKTTTVLELLRQLWLEQGVPFLVIEPVNSDADDYRRFLSEPGFDALEVITIGDEGGHPLRFNPFEVPKNVLVGEHTANLLACFKAAFGLWEPLPSIYQDALDLTYLNAGILASERPDGATRRWPTVVEFSRAMRKATSDLGYAGEVKANIEAASIRRAQQLGAGACASTFLTDLPNQIERLIDHPVVLELKSLGSGDEQALMMALLLNALTEYYQSSRGASAQLVHLTIIEEAHRLLSRSSGGKAQEEAQAKEKAAEAFANTLAENRKYGEGVMIVEQVPTKLVEDAVKNTNLKILHRLTAEDDREYVGATMGFDEAQLRFATRLQTGEGLVYSDEMSEAMEVKVRPHLAATSPGPLGARPSPPLAACEACRAKCRYRGAALSMVRDQSVVTAMEERVRSLEDQSASGEEVARRWEGLVFDLRTRVAAFPALPSSEPGLSDAAYCLFLHSLSARTMRYSAAWPNAVARRLGLSVEDVAASSSGATDDHVRTEGDE